MSKKKTETKNIETPITEATIEEAQVNRAKELDEREKTLNEKEHSLQERETSLEEKEHELKEKENELTQKENELSAKEKQLLEGNESKPAKHSPKEFEFNGDKYRFVADAPQRIRIEGAVKTQEQIIADEDLLLQLIGGNSSLIQKI